MRPTRPTLLRLETLLQTIPLALASGVAFGICPAPREWPVTAFVGAALLLGAIDHGGPPPSARRGFVAGLACAFVIDVMALYWVVELLQTFAFFPLVLAILVGGLLFAAQAIPFGIAGAMASSLSARGAPAWLVLPACIVVVSSLAPTLFPWRLADSQTGFVEWLQLAELGGAPILDVCICLVGTGLAETARRAAAKRPLASVAVPLATALLAFFVPLAWGLVRLPEVRAAREAAPVLDIGIVQPNVAIFEKHDPRLAPYHLGELQRATARLEARGADVVVWPETAYPFPVLRVARFDGERSPRLLGSGAHGPVLAGAITRSEDQLRYNSAVAVARGGRFVGITDKVELLAFGEYVPLWDYLPPIQERFPRGLTPGDVPRTVTLADVRMGVLNCYEDVLAHHARNVARQSPDVLVNVTNDAWFGDTSEPWLHEAVARLRAVETRRDLVRVVNTGVSSHAAATGELLVRTPTFVAAELVVPARLLSGTTFWVRFGDLVTPILAGALLGAAFALRVRR